MPLHVCSPCRIDLHDACDNDAPCRRPMCWCVACEAKAQRKLESGGYLADAAADRSMKEWTAKQKVLDREEFDRAVGALSRLLSQFGMWSRRSDWDEADRHTISRIAGDLIVAGQEIKKYIK